VAPPADAAVLDGVDCQAPAGCLFAGGGLYLLQPYFTANPAYSVYQETKGGQATPMATGVDFQHLKGPPPSQPSQGGGGLDTATVTRVDLSHHMDVAPMLWLGYAGPGGLGGRVRWWCFSQASSQTQMFPPSTGPTEVTLVSAAPLGPQLFANTDKGQSAAFAATSALEMQVGDIEVFQDFAGCKWDVLLSGGVRIAHLNQDYSAFVTESAGASALHETLISGHNFTGAGPVLAAEGRRGLGCGLALYGSVRGALLYGSARQNVLSTGSPGDPSPTAGSDHRDKVLPVGELELGLEYGRCVGPAWLFGQIGLVGQDWLGAGNASRTATAGVPTGFPIFNATVDNDLGLLGLAVRVGVSY
jgi:hypothetical protein